MEPGAALRTDSERDLRRDDVLWRDAGPQPSGRALLLRGLLAGQALPPAGLLSPAPVQRGYSLHVPRLTPGRCPVPRPDVAVGLRAAGPLPQRLELPGGRPWRDHRHDR